MTNMAIIVEKVMKPEIFANALQKEIYTVQVHRRNNFWDYKAVEAAQAELSLTAFQLYMYLERQNTNAPWCVWPSKLAKETQLDEYTLLGAVIELKKRGYLTPGTSTAGQMTPARGTPSTLPRWTSSVQRKPSLSRTFVNRSSLKHAVSP